MTTKYEITLAVDHHEGTEFAAWLALGEQADAERSVRKEAFEKAKKKPVKKKR